MKTINELELLSSYTLKDVQNNNLEALSLISKLYARLYNKKLNKGCSNCHIDAYIELMIMLKKESTENIIKMSERKFIMNKTSIIDTSMFKKQPRGMFSHANMTDEIAVGLLKISQGYIKFFTQFPKNWQELLKDEIKTDESDELIEEIEIVEPVKIEVQELINEPISVNTKRNYTPRKKSKRR